VVQHLVLMAKTELMVPMAQTQLMVQTQPMVTSCRRYYHCFHLWLAL
jgi:hypothetical protein